MFDLKDLLKVWNYCVDVKIYDCSTYEVLFEGDLDELDLNDPITDYTVDGIYDGIDGFKGMEIAVVVR